MRLRRVLAAIALAATAVGLSAAPRGSTFVFEVEMANPKGGTAQLFYDIGQWISGVDSSTAVVPAGERLRTYRFAIPPEPVRQLRFDPDVGAATVLIGQMRLLGPGGEVVIRIGPEALRPMHSIEALRIRDGIATVRMGPDDPMLLIDFPFQPATQRALGSRLAGPGTVLTLGLAVAAMAAWVAATLWLRLVRGKAVAALLVGIFCLVAGARLCWLREYSRPMPFLDEWETDALDLLIPLRGGYLNAGALFMPQAEHRILMTRLLTVDGCLLNGEWDPRVAMTAGTLLVAAAVAMAAAMAAAKSGRAGMVAGFALAGSFCLPFDYSNLFWGDQSQMYALVVAAIAVLALAALVRPTGPEFAAVGCAALLSLFTMGSGFVAPGLGAAVCAMRARLEEEHRRRLLALAGLLGSIALLGAALYRPAPFYSPDYTQNWASFWPALRGHLSWPLPDGLLSIAIVWAPWAALCLTRLGRRSATPLDYFAAAAGGWALINAAGLAHGRPRDQYPFDSKYYTTLATGAAASLLSTAGLFQAAGRHRSVKFLAGLASAAALWALLSFGWSGIRGTRSVWSSRCACDDVVRPYLATHDYGTLARATPLYNLPDWNPAELAARLDSPGLQPWLPAMLRQSLASRPGAAVHGLQAPGPLTSLCRDLMKAGVILGVAGLVLLAAALRWTGRKSSAG